MALVHDCGIFIISPYQTRRSAGFVIHHVIVS